MSAGEFYALTPVEFENIYQEYKRAQLRSDANWARLCWVVATSAGCKLPDPNNPQPKDPLAIPFDYYMPGYQPPKKRKVKPVDPVAALIAMFPGRINDLRPKKK